MFCSFFFFFGFLLLFCFGVLLLSSSLLFCSNLHKEMREGLKKKKKCGKGKPETTAGGWEWSERLEEDTLVSTSFCPKD